MTRLSFEKITETLEKIPPAEADGHFAIEWLVPDLLAVGKSSTGAHCIFMVCEPLTPSAPVVARAVRFGQWQPVQRPLIGCNLLALPSAPEFGIAAAAITSEILRRSSLLGESLPETFDRVEEFIALVLRRVLMPPSLVLGLLGELFVLDEILDAMKGSWALGMDPTRVWRGWAQQSRDFVFGVTSLEIKTTGLRTSKHSIHSLDQVEARVVDGCLTETLFLGSIGMRTAPEGSYSVSALEVVTDPAAIAKLLHGARAPPRACPPGQLRMFA